MEVWAPPIIPETAEEPEPDLEKAKPLIFEDGEKIEEAWRKAANHFEADFAKIETKIHRFPASLRGLGKRYIAPTAVAIGPYHRPSASEEHLVEMESVKDVAAYDFVKASGYSLETMYWAVRGVEEQVRSAYTDKATHMDGSLLALTMFRDGCFLLQYMLMCTDPYQLAPSLLCFLTSNQAVISQDIMLLENQIPWVVIEALTWFRAVAVEEFIAKMGRTLQVRGDGQRTPFMLDGYRPPHLLGLLHYYKTGRQITGFGIASSVGLRPMSKTISAIELQEMGIKLTPSKTTKLIDMGIKKTLLSGEIFLPPLLLDEIRSCWLINMAAFEISMGMGTFARKDVGQPVVCSYIAVLAMLMDREEDVHALRTKRLVQGELTNNETLHFFKTLIKHISPGTLYIHIMEEIEVYKLKRRIWVKLHAFIYKNFKTIVTVITIISVIVGIFKTLLSLNRH